MTDVKLEDLTEEKFDKMIKELPLMPSCEAGQTISFIMSEKLLDLINYGWQAVKWYMENRDKVHDINFILANKENPTMIAIDGTYYVSFHEHKRKMDMR